MILIRKKKLLICSGAILCILLVVAAALGVFVAIRPQKAARKAIDAVTVIPYLKDGDIILRLGDGPLSPAFKDLSSTDKRFSHLGIVRIREDAISIINAVGSLMDKDKGVDEVPLDMFLQVAKELGIYRAKCADGTEISDKAVTYIGYPFDWGFDITDDSKIYCTELLYAVLKSVAPEYQLATLYFDKLEKNVIPLDSVSNSADFDEIAYFH